MADLCNNPNCKSHQELHRLQAKVKSLIDANATLRTANDIQRKTILTYEHKISALNEILREERSTRVSLHITPVVTVDKVQTAMQTT